MMVQVPLMYTIYFFEKANKSLFCTTNILLYLLPYLFFYITILYLILDYYYVNTSILCVHCNEFHTIEQWTYL